MSPFLYAAQWSYLQILASRNVVDWQTVTDVSKDTQEDQSKAPNLSQSIILCTLGCLCLNPTVKISEEYSPHRERKLRLVLALFKDDVSAEIKQI